MLKRLREYHPYLYCLLTVALFVVVMMVGLNLFAVLLALLGPAFLRPFLIEEYLLQAVNDLFGFLVALVLLWRTRRLGVLTRRGTGFWDGLLVGMFPFVLLSLSLSLNVGVLGPPEGAVPKAPWRVVVFLITMFLIGLAEEAVFRGVIAQTLLEHFGPDRAGVWKAVVLSGFLFGAGHAVNLLESATLGVLIQCCITMALGMLYAAIYFRTGNLWVVIFLHAFQDTAALINSGLYEGTAGISEVVSTYDPSMLVSVLLYLVPTVILLRKSRLPEVGIFSGIEPAPPAAAGQPGPDQAQN